MPTSFWNEHGPFDIIGDIHGCLDELCLLLQQLGYAGCPEQITAPAGRRIVFLGDLVDRGPYVVETLRLVMRMFAQGQAFCIPGNHDDKLLRYLKGNRVQLQHGLAETVAQLERESKSFREQVRGFLQELPSHLVLDEGRLVVAHAGLKEAFHGEQHPAARAFALFGDTTGKLDAYGLPIRLNWAEHYRGKALIVYGHTPVPGPRWENNTVNIDTGCVFGGQLTCLRYPERETVSVPAGRQYATPVRPFLPGQG